jgi:hypothetical protein
MHMRTRSSDINTCADLSGFFCTLLLFAPAHGVFIGLSDFRSTSAKKTMLTKAVRGREQQREEVIYFSEGLQWCPGR